MRKRISVTVKGNYMKKITENDLYNRRRKLDKDYIKIVRSIVKKSFICPYKLGIVIIFVLMLGLLVTVIF